MQIDSTLVRMIKLARGLEMGGFYNAGKILWAMAYSEEMRASNQAGVPGNVSDLDRELGDLILELKAAGAASSLVEMLEKSREAVRNEAAIPYQDVPGVHVCRSCGEIVVGGAPETCPACGAWELTFRTFPAVHYLEPLPPDEALSKLAEVPDLLDSMINGLSDADLEKVPSPGEWNLKQIFAHFLTTQELLAGRVTRMLTEEDPELKAMTAAELSDPANMSGREMLERWSASRAKTVTELNAAAPLGWWRTGQHQEFGSVTVLQQASYFAKHDHNHLTQVKATIKAFG